MPEEFGRYELHDLLGRGGMGEVYRALDTVRERTVALKLLSKYLAEDESFKSRFRRESRMVARLNEPHIIPIHDFGEIDNQLFIDMRLVEGADLGTVLANGGALGAEVAISVISQVASALDAAHRSGLVHRDVKPSNILLTGLGPDRGGDPFAYLVDFGIAHSATQEGTVLTATTGTVGTVAYMSPERIGGDSGDHTTDVYALACVLHETLSGHKPFDGELFAMMYAHMHTAPPKVTARQPDLPAGLDAVICKGMSKNAEERYPTAGEFARDARAALRADTRHAPAPSRPSPVPPVSHEPTARSGAASPSSSAAGPPVMFAPTPPPPSRSPEGPPARPVAHLPPPVGEPRRDIPPPSEPVAHLPPPVGEPRRDIPPPSEPVSWQPPPTGGGQWSTPPGHPSGPISPYPPAPPNPPRRRGALIAGVTALLLAVVVVTYLLAKDSKKNPTVVPTTSISAGPSKGDFPSAPTGSRSSSSGGLAESSAKVVVARYLDDVNAQDRTDAETLICPELRTTRRTSIDKTSGDFTVTVTNSSFESSTKVSAGLDLKYSLDVKSTTTSKTVVSPVTFTIVDRSGEQLICGEK